MKAWAVVAHNAPLECVELPDPEPVGTEVVVEVTHCGVCHSDLHLWHGGYDLGGGRMLLVKDRGLVLPAAPMTEVVRREKFRDTYLARIPLRRWSTPAEVAKPIAFLLSDAASYITGQHLGINGGAHMTG